MEEGLCGGQQRGGGQAVAPEVVQEDLSWGAVGEG